MLNALLVLKLGHQVIVLFGEGCTGVSLLVNLKLSLFLSSVHLIHSVIEVLLPLNMLMLMMSSFNQ